MASSFTNRLTIGERSTSSSILIWAVVTLFALSLLLATLASFAGNSGTPGFNNPATSATPTPSTGSTPGPTPSNGGIPVSNVPGLSSDDAVPASEALQPIFGDGQPNIALLVSSATSLTEREVEWVSDIEFELGSVQLVSYSDASFEVLSDYLTLFVIDSNGDFDPSVLSLLSDRGVTIHLIGAASAYAESLDLEVEAE